MTNEFRAGWTIKIWSLVGERTSLGMCLGLVYLIFRPFLCFLVSVSKEELPSVRKNFSIMMLCHHRLLAMEQLTTD